MNPQGRDNPEGQMPVSVSRVTSIWPRFPSHAFSFRLHRAFPSCSELSSQSCCFCFVLSEWRAAGTRTSQTWPGHSSRKPHPSVTSYLCHSHTLFLKKLHCLTVLQTVALSTVKRPYKSQSLAERSLHPETVPPESSREQRHSGWGEEAPTQVRWPGISVQTLPCAHLFSVLRETQQ